MNCGRFCERLFPMRFFSSTPQSNRETFFRNKILIPLCLSYENCKRPRRSHIPKHENCNILVCNFHISLQFSLSVVWFLRGRLQFSYGFAIFIWVCNFHISLHYIIITHVSEFVPTTGWDDYPPRGWVICRPHCVVVSVVGRSGWLHRRICRRSPAAGENLIQRCPL